MLEAVVALSIAAATGIGVTLNRTHVRFMEQDRRIDGIELKIAERYITRGEVSESLRRFEDHILRIEQKLDKLTT